MYSVYMYVQHVMSFIIPNIAVITYRDDVSAAVVDDVSVLRGDSGLSWRDVTAASGGVMLVASSATVTCARHDQYMSRHRVKSWYMYSRRQHASHRHVYTHHKVHVRNLGKAQLKLIGDDRHTVIF